MQKRLSAGVQFELKPHMFTAVSVDNIDILQPYSFVSSLDLTRSWHVSLVQCVQPHPISGHLTSEDTLSSSLMDGSNSCKHARSLPICTPIAVEKHKKENENLDRKCILLTSFSYGAPRTNFKPSLPNGVRTFYPNTLPERV